ncbi:hypothetical protein KZO11_34450 [Streptomyces anulatus]|uniref:hypothetical protein n=1 Tax=Streptomyces anulatus TaxID=1892 RepID=UPI001C602F07|nr:hypothetical protein [Streptomyces anulatus]QYA98322.1 hypothetical protein KZO11_34450 [Streptomyces anulatus]
MTTRAFLHRRAAAARVLVAAVTLSGALAVSTALPSPASETSAARQAADTVVTQSPHHTVEFSTLAAKPGDSLTITVTSTNDTDAPVYSQTGFYSDKWFLTDTADCTTLQGIAPDFCEVYGETGFQGSDISYGYPDPDNGIPAHSTVKMSVTTTIRADAQPGTYTLEEDGTINDRAEV